jgi:hypothetical protein
MVPLSASLVVLLRRHRKEQNERRQVAGEAWVDAEYVFDRGDGRPVDPDALGRASRGDHIGDRIAMRPRVP